MSASSVTPPKGQPTAGRGNSAARALRRGIDPRVSWALLALGVVVVLVLLAVAGWGDGGASHTPGPVGGHTGG